MYDHDSFTVQVQFIVHRQRKRKKDDRKGSGEIKKQNIEVKKRHQKNREIDFHIRYSLVLERWTVKVLYSKKGLGKVLKLSLTKNVTSKMVKKVEFQTAKVSQNIIKAILTKFLEHLRKVPYTVDCTMYNNLLHICKLCSVSIGRICRYLYLFISSEGCLFIRTVVHI